MFKTYTIKEKKEWQSILRKFSYVDIYYYPDYAFAYQSNNEGEVQLIHYIDNDLEVINVVIKRDISCHPNFKSSLEKELYYDYITPYGYGGPLFSKEVSCYESEKIL